VFIAPDLSSIAVRHAKTPLEVCSILTPSAVSRIANDNEMVTVIPFIPPRTLTKNRQELSSLKRTTIRYDGDISNCYAVIISGGYNQSNNHIRYWGDASLAYSTLTLKYGYLKKNIYALISDGLDPTVDRSNNTDSPTDLDGDGLVDTYAAATAVNVSNVVTMLQTKLQPTDQLFVFLTDHGGPTKDGEIGEVGLNLWNKEVMTDYELRNLAEPIECPIVFAMEQCYSGGFVEDLMQSNRVVVTAANSNESSWAGSTYPEFNQWAYYYISALRGFFPNTNAPWLDDAACDGDLNDDGYVSFEEAYKYAMINKYSGDNPTYGENPIGLGKQMFPIILNSEDLGMGEFVIDPIMMPQIAYSGFPVRVVAQNVFGDIMADYSGPIDLKVETTPFDPGEYIGSGELLWEYPMYTYYMDARTQIIYSPETMGDARTIDSFQVYVDDATTYAMSNWTIRLKHTPLLAYTESPEWETNGWAVVFTSNMTSVASGWVMFKFNQSFEYNGVDSLMVDFSFYNDDYASYVNCKASEASNTNYVSITGCSDNQFGDPLLWTGNTPTPNRSLKYLNLRFGPPEVPVNILSNPKQVSAFSDGEWQGNVAVLGTNDNIRLWVEDETHDGWLNCSDWFAVRDYRLEFVGNMVDLIDGSFQLQWSSGTGRTYRVMETPNLNETFSALATNLPANPPLNTFGIEVEKDGTWFFKVEEETKR
jgi:hypothetical protein